MQVPFVFGPGDLRLCEIPAPIAGSADVLLRVGSVGVCGSDLGFVAAGGVVGPTATPIPIGHELSGTVIAAGKDVSGIAIGDRVVVNPLVNLIGNGGSEGGFAEQLLIREVASRPKSLIKLPDVLTLEQGALVEPLAVAAHALNQLGVQPGHRVAVFGAGPIGLAAVVVLRARGVDDIVVFEPSAFRRERAERLGARHAIDPLERRADEALRAVHGEVPLFRAKAPATTHFLEASGAPVIADIIALARAGARICVASVPKKPVSVDFATVGIRELVLTGSLGYPCEFPEVIAMLEKGLKAGTIDLAPMVSHCFAGEDFMEAFAMAGQPERAAKVLVRYDARPRPV
jgi:threonine dehydrogenase-like Zn-dependent dehydrogenase